MKIKKILRAKRAFSPVIASLILMLLAVASGVVVYGYTMGWIGGATQTSGGQKGELQIDSIVAAYSTDVITIYVRNVGGKDLTLEYVYVEGNGFNNSSPNCTIPSTTLSVQSVHKVIIDTTDTVDLQDGYFYEVKVACKDGTTVSQSVEAK